MSRKRIIIGESAWTVADAEVETVRQEISKALADGSVGQLNLLNADGGAVTVYLNGRVTPMVVVDEDAGPRPGEISG